MIGKTVFLFALAAATITPAAAQPAPAAAPCAGPQYHQLDYWVGEWDVFDTAKGYQVGTSRIAGVLGGCAIHESYDSPQARGGAYAGNSYSAFEPKDGKWHQYYVDSNGSTTWFTGGMEGASMTLLAPGKKDGMTIRMRYVPGDGGSVRQVGDTSADGGKSWQPSYDYTYRRKAAAAAGR